RTAEPFSRRPGNLDVAPAHPGRGPGIGVAVDREPAASHASAGMNAGIALDPDLAVAQVLPDPVQPVACSLDTQLVGAARSQSERIADGHAMFGRLQFDPLDLRRRFACEELRHQT